MISAYLLEPHGKIDLLDINYNTEPFPILPEHLGHLFHNTDIALGPQDEGQANILAMLIPQPPLFHPETSCLKHPSRAVHVKCVGKHFFVNIIGSKMRHQPGCCWMGMTMKNHLAYLFAVYSISQGFPQIRGRCRILTAIEAKLVQPLLWEHRYLDVFGFI